MEAPSLAAVTPQTDSFLSSRLNAAQKEAVTAPDGPLLILAGAGSGKTRVIAYRIAYLVMERKVPPDQILAVTFTNKAAGEMKTRVGDLIGPSAKAVTLGTFHSICARWLRRWIPRIGYESTFSIYDDGDQSQLIKRLYVDAGINPKQHPPAAVRSAISKAKEALITPPQYSQQADSPFELAVAAIYRRYQEALQDQNALDFDDLLVLMLRVLEEAPDVLERLRQQFRHVLVDEYQDVNKVQYLLVKHLASAHRNLTIVGDDSQAIYGWRGADVRYILEFEHDWSRITAPPRPSSGRRRRWRRGLDHGARRRCGPKMTRDCRSPSATRRTSVMRRCSSRAKSSACTKAASTTGTWL
jgi:DNA helicase II / ATP-dependent DNA helicase PcrA